MPDLDGGVLLGGPVLLDQPAAPAAQPPIVLAVGWEFGPIVAPGPNGQPHAALVMKFTLPDGVALPPVVVVVDEDDLLKIPDFLRKAIREARHAAEDARRALTDPPTEEETTDA